jgi:hypothetical protein
VRPSKSASGALIQELEIEAERRRQERVAKGEFVQGPAIVVGFPGSVERAKANAIMALREQGEKREIIFDDVIITGVPRHWRDYGIEPWPTSPV